MRKKVPDNDDDGDDDEFWANRDKKDANLCKNVHNFVCKQNDLTSLNQSWKFENDFILQNKLFQTKNSLFI